jgi:hypothetical protein
MWQVVSGIGVLQVIAICKRRHRTSGCPAIPGSYWAAKHGVGITRAAALDYAAAGVLEYLVCLPAVCRVIRRTYSSGRLG